LGFVVFTLALCFKIDVPSFVLPKFFSPSKCGKNVLYLMRYEGETFKDKIFIGNLFCPKIICYAS